ncbi:hypothetical protein QUB70_04790 [Microcoleus sp. A003_D6]|uniref:hypothetical protein n=1 Tax=Microcoleus sp. A003_D6 TaxID=3055266 RepID=UPI002FD3B345
MLEHLHRRPIDRFANAIVTASQASKKDRPDKLNFHQQQLTTNKPVGQMNKHTCVIATGHQATAKLSAAWCLAAAQHSSASLAAQI